MDDIPPDSSIKGIAQNLSTEAPVVKTAIGGHGMHAVNHESYMVAKDNQEFAKRTVYVYIDEQPWTRISRKGLKLVREKYYPAIARTLLVNVLNQAVGLKYTKVPLIIQVVNKTVQTESGREEYDKH